MKFEFVESREDRYNAKIKVIGIGGGGGNAINNMISSKLKGVEFITANTDIQALEKSACSYKIQLGPTLTRGLGAGSDPEIGRAAAEESEGELREALSGADMTFITAGMGGGTGTGASQIVARIAKEQGALTVAVVTKPFKFEGEKRMKRAMEGIKALKEEVDTLIVIPNERLKHLAEKNTTFKELIVKADEVLLQAVKGISDLIMSEGFINLDFADVKKVMEQMGTAIMGTGRASGQNRALEAAEKAINSPLLEDMSIRGAKGLLMNITGPSDMTMEEIDEASNYIKEEVDSEAEIFWGVVFDDTMKDEIQITVIATGIDKDKYHNVVKLRDVSSDEEIEPWTVRNVNGDILETPTYQRMSVKDGDLDGQENQVKKKRGIFKKGFFRENLDYPAFLRLRTEQ